MTKNVHVNKRHTKIVVINPFKEAEQHEQFGLLDGRLLANVRDLADALEHMSDEVYSHHVSSKGNDFSNWLSAVLNEPDLAEDLKSVTNQQQAQLAVLKHIARKAF